MNNKIKIVITVLFATAISTPVAQSWADEGSDGISVALQAENLAVVAAGEKIYQAQCASCHGAQLQGQPEWRIRDENGLLPAPPHDETGHTWHHADDLLFEITKFGPGTVIGDADYKTMMPAYKDVLTDDEIVAVLSFIKHSWPEDERSWNDEVNGTQQSGFKTIKKKSTLLEKLLK
jgi:mono/diheme cytochrome c family protein